VEEIPIPSEARTLRAATPADQQVGEPYRWYRHLGIQVAAMALRFAQDICDIERLGEIRR
jgi:hypothetical protein